MAKEKPDPRGIQTANVRLIDFRTQCRYTSFVDILQFSTRKSSKAEVPGVEEFCDGILKAASGKRVET